MSIQAFDSPLFFFFYRLSITTNDNMQRAQRLALAKENKMNTAKHQKSSQRRNTVNACTTTFAQRTRKINHTSQQGNTINTDKMILAQLKQKHLKHDAIFLLEPLADTTLQAQFA